MTKVPFDAYITKIAIKYSLGLLKTEEDINNEGGHLLIHACITLLVLTLPISPYFALVSFAFGLFKEFYLDGLGQPWNPVNKHDARNLLFRSIGSFLPFLTLLWS